MKSDDTKINLPRKLTPSRAFFCSTTPSRALLDDASFARRRHRALSRRIMRTASGAVRRNTRAFHTSRSIQYDTRPVLAFNHVEPPSPEAAKG